MSRSTMILGGVVLVVGVAASVVVFGEDFERLVTDVEAERAHPSLANAGRVVGQAARTAKDALGIASDAAAIAALQIHRGCWQFEGILARARALGMRHQGIAQVSIETRDTVHGRQWQRWSGSHWRQMQAPAVAELALKRGRETLSGCRVMLLVPAYQKPSMTARLQELGTRASAPGEN